MEEAGERRAVQNNLGWKENDAGVRIIDPSLLRMEKIQKGLEGEEMSKIN